MLWFARATALRRVAAAVAVMLAFPLLVLGSNAGGSSGTQTPSGYPARPITLIVPFA